MKKSFSIILPLLLIISVHLSGKVKATANTDRERVEYILNSEDSDFRNAVINVLKESNITNPELFFNELKSIESSERGSDSKNESGASIFGFANIGTEYNGYSGWDVAAGGVITVFIGLTLISTVVLLFNLLLQSKQVNLSVTDESSLKKDNEGQEESNELAEVPEDHITAIATAVELYYRLYIDRSNSGITFSNNDSSQWRVGTKFGVRKTQRK